MLTEQTKTAILRAPSKQLHENVEAIKTSLNPTVVEICRFITSVLAGRNKSCIVGWTMDIVSNTLLRRNLTQGDIDAMTADWAAIARTEQDTEYREQLAAELEETMALDQLQRLQAFEAATHDVRLY